MAKKKAATKKKPRDYRKQHEARKAKTKRLLADVDIALAERLRDFLAETGRTFKEWIIQKIKEDLNE